MQFVFDFISPYAYFASLRVRDVADKHGVVVEPMPVLFAGLLAHWGQLGPAEIPPKRLWTYKDIHRTAFLHGVPLTGPAKHPFNPLTALRLALPEVAGSDQWTVIDAIYAAGWGHGADLGDPEHLQRALDDAGLDGTAMLQRTRDPEVKLALKRSTSQAIERGVFGVPTFLIGEELFWGNDRFDQVELYLSGEDPIDPTKVQEHLSRPQAHRRRG